MLRWRRHTSTTKFWKICQGSSSSNEGWWGVEGGEANRQTHAFAGSGEIACARTGFFATKSVSELTCARRERTKEGVKNESEISQVTEDDKE